MPTASLNWHSDGSQQADTLHTFGFGADLSLRDCVLHRGNCRKGCTLDASLEHQSKVSQLQMVCTASSLQISIVQAMNAHDFKWITQLRGTPLPNQPDMFYFRTPEELLSQKLWRLRVKFLFSSTSVTAIRIQSLSLCFEKLTQNKHGVRASASEGASTTSSSSNDSGTGLRPSSARVNAHGVAGLLRAGLISTRTSTTASLTTTPTGASTPRSLSVYEDGSEASDEADSVMRNLQERSLSKLQIDRGSEASDNGTGTGARIESMENGARHPRLDRRRKSSSSTVSGGGSAGGQSGGVGVAAERETGRALRRRNSEQDVVVNLVKVIDQVVSQMRSGPTLETADRVLLDELLQLRSRVHDHTRRKEAEDDLEPVLARIGIILGSVSK